jgi:hypothetical protein
MLMLITYGVAFLVIPVHVAFIFGEQRLETTAVPTLVSIISEREIERELFSFSTRNNRLNNVPLPLPSSFPADAIYIMDIAINFLSCYQDKLTKKIELDRGKVAANYMRNYFWIDVLSSLPDRVIITWVSAGDSRCHRLRKCQMQML